MIIYIPFISSVFLFILGSTSGFVMLKPPTNSGTVIMTVPEPLFYFAVTIKEHLTESALVNSACYEMAIIDISYLQPTIAFLWY